MQPRRNTLTNRPTHRVHRCERFLCQNASAAPLAVRYRFAALFHALWNPKLVSCTAPFAVLSRWDQRGQIGFVSVGSEAAKAVAVSWDQRVSVDNSGLMSIDPERGRWHSPIGEGEVTRKKQKRSRKNRSSTKERRSKPPETLSEYDEAVAIYTYHVEEKGRADLAVDLAMNLTNRSNALRDLGRHGEAEGDLTKAVFIFTRLVEHEGREDLIGHLALTLSNRAGVFKDLDRLAEAVTDYGKAIAIYTRLVEKQGHVELTRNLAIILSDRGCILRRWGSLRRRSPISIKLSLSVPVWRSWGVLMRLTPLP